VPCGTTTTSSDARAAAALLGVRLTESSAPAGPAPPYFCRVAAARAATRVLDGTRVVFVFGRVRTGRWSRWPGVLMGIGWNNDGILRTCGDGAECETWPGCTVG
jgi:hypothetical protein